MKNFSRHPVRRHWHPEALRVHLEAEWEWDHPGRTTIRLNRETMRFEVVKIQSKKQKHENRK